MAVCTEDDLKLKWKYLKSAVLNTVQDQKGERQAIILPPYGDIIMDWTVKK